MFPPQPHCATVSCLVAQGFPVISIHWYFVFSFSEAAVIISKESGSRTIVYNPGNQEPLNASEFALAFERSQSSFHWIHFEARPFVHYMLSYLSNKDKEVSRPLRHSVIMLFFNFGCVSHYGAAGKNWTTLNHFIPFKPFC